MRIVVDSHTLLRAEERGTSEAEIKDVLTTGFPIAAKHGRLGKAKVYDFNRSRHGKLFQHKRVEVIYLIDRDELITVTVYVFFGAWERSDANKL